MGRKKLTDEEKIDSRKRQFERQAEYTKQVFDRVSLVLKKGLKDRIKEEKVDSGEYKSLNDYINKLIEKDLK